MNILYIHQYFRTPDEPGGTRSYWISLELIKDGHNVTMITSGKADQSAKLSRKIIDGINVIYIRNAYSQDFSVARRLLSFIGFVIKSTYLLLKQKKTDLVIATSTPLTVGIPALIIKKLKGIPYVFEVRDLWPEVPIQMGAIKNSIVKRMAKKLERKIYEGASQVVALSPGMRQGIIEVTGKPDEVCMIPNMAKTDKFWKRAKDISLMKELNLDISSFKIIHFGSMGRANGLNYIIEAARILREKEINNVEIIFLGKGSESDKIIKSAQETGLGFIKFPGAFSMEKTSEIVNLCDVSIVPFLNLPILATNSPNKLFDSLSAGIPIIINSNGWTREMVEQNQCGAYVDPEKPEELADLIVRWKDDRPLLDKMSQNARKLAESTYDKTILCRKFADLISNFT